MEILELLDKLDTRKIQDQVKELQAIAKWAYEQVGFKDGERARIRKGYEVQPVLKDGTTYNGWWGYRECLIGGALCTVTEVKFSTVHNRWYCLIRLDEEWSVDKVRLETVRWWHGPADKTPEGMKAPSEYDQEHYPEGRKHTFMFWPEDLEKIGE